MFLPRCCIAPRPSRAAHPGLVRRSNGALAVDIQPAHIAPDRYVRQGAAAVSVSGINQQMPIWVCRFRCRRHPAGGSCCQRDFSSRDWHTVSCLWAPLSIRSACTTATPRRDTRVRRVRPSVEVTWVASSPSVRYTGCTSVHSSPDERTTCSCRSVSEIWGLRSSAKTSRFAISRVRSRWANAVGGLDDDPAAQLGTARGADDSLGAARTDVVCGALRAEQPHSPRGFRDAQGDNDGVVPGQNTPDQFDVGGVPVDAIEALEWGHRGCGTRERRYPVAALEQGVAYCPA